MAIIASKAFQERRAVTSRPKTSGGRSEQYRLDWRRPVPIGLYADEIDRMPKVIPPRVADTPGIIAIDRFILVKTAGKCANVIQTQCRTDDHCQCDEAYRDPVQVAHSGSNPPGGAFGKSPGLQIPARGRIVILLLDSLRCRNICPGWIPGRAIHFEASRLYNTVMDRIFSDGLGTDMNY